MRIMNLTADQIFTKIRGHRPVSDSEQRQLILRLCAPAIMAQLSVILMQMIDAGMAGRLGASASAAIGLVTSSTWLFNGICSGAVFGFSVQTSHAIGADDMEEARNLSRQGLYAVLLTGFLIGFLGASLSSFIPVWLGGEDAILQDAAGYLSVFCLSIPFVLLNSWAVQMLQGAGDTRLPGLVQVIMCLLDVAFNYLFIFVCSLGVIGAALGTAAAEICSSLFLAYWVICRNPFLKGSMKCRYTRRSLRNALITGLPVSAEQLITGTSYVMFTRIVSSLGSVAVAANSFAITAESLCYMPGYGCAAAGTAIIGQCTGAGEERLTRQIGWRIVRIGVGMMSLSAVFLFLLAGFLMNLLTPVAEIAALGSFVLRMEAFAEPMYGASIVVTGILRGKGDTFWPAMLSLLSIWCIRIPLAWLLSQSFGLPGAWMAMNIELNIRGILFLLRMKHAWKKKSRSAAPGQYSGQISAS